MSGHGGDVIVAHCGGCGKALRRVRLMAHVQHERVADTRHWLYQCETPDCDTQLVIEEDANV